MRGGDDSVRATGTHIPSHPPPHPLRLGLLRATPPTLLESERKVQLPPEGTPQGRKAELLGEGPKQDPTLSPGSQRVATHNSVLKLARHVLETILIFSNKVSFFFPSPPLLSPLFLSCGCPPPSLFLFHAPRVLVPILPGHLISLPELPSQTCRF